MKTSPVQHHCTVTSFKMLTPTVFETQFESTPALEFQAGQFISIIIPEAGPNGKNLRRAYSIASAPEKRPVELCVKQVAEGPGTEFLFRLRPGDSFEAIAPYGDFIFRPQTNRHIFFIATGTGIAPFRSIVTSKLYQANPPISATCLLGVRSIEEILYHDTFKSLPNIKWIQAISQPTSQDSAVPASGFIKELSQDQSPFKGRVTDYLSQLSWDYPWSHCEFYLCGNGQMIQEVKNFLSLKNVLKSSIHQEKYY